MRPQIQARTVEIGSEDPERVNITWINDAPEFDESHQTSLNMKDLRGLVDTGAMPGPFQDALQKQALWAKDDYCVPDTDFADYMANDEAVYGAMKQLRTHGLIFVTNIPHLEDALEKIATRMGPMKDTFYGYTWDGEMEPS